MSPLFNEPNQLSSSPFPQNVTQTSVFSLIIFELKTSTSVPMFLRTSSPLGSSDNYLKVSCGNSPPSQAAAPCVSFLLPGHHVDTSEEFGLCCCGDEGGEVLPFVSFSFLILNHVVVPKALAK